MVDLINGPHEAQVATFPLIKDIQPGDGLFVARPEDTKLCEHGPLIGLEHLYTFALFFFLPLHLLNPLLNAPDFVGQFLDPPSLLGDLCLAL